MSTMAISPRYAHHVPLHTSPRGETPPPPYHEQKIHYIAPTPPINDPPIQIQSVSTWKIIAWCIIWYSSSAFTNNSSKLILNEYSYPVTLTTFQFGIAAMVTLLVSKLANLTTIKPPSKAIIMTILPLCFFQVGGHSFTSVSLSYLPVSIVHTIKASSPLFTVFFYRMLYKISYPLKVYGSLVPLSVGVALTLINKVIFHPIGFVAALISCIIFVIQNIFSKKLFNTTNGNSNVKINPAKLDKLNLLFYSNLAAFVCSIPIWLKQDVPREDYALPSLYIVGIFILNGFSHFMQNLLAFHLLSLVSPITYSIASLIKRIYVIIASIIWFGDKITMVQGIGICLTFIGLYLYQDAKKEVDLREVLIEKEDVLPTHKPANGMPLAHPHTG